MTNYHLYFAFGSNMLEERFRQRCSSALLVRGYGVIENYNLVFNRKGDYENGGVASIIPLDGEVVYGAIYLINTKDLETLDKIESPNGESYYRETISVKTLNNQSLECYTYLAHPEGDFKPTRKYLNWIIEGGIKINLPVDYLKKLAGISSID